jgi:hexosaminidase
MLDVSRHWMPAGVVRRNLDAMAALKLNVFHWHLSDDQGFRVESKRFPKLHEMGSDGHYYTQRQVRDIIDFARERGIRVVPEFDMPGHATAWFVGYPELASAPGPYSIERKWGIFDPAMDPTRNEVYRFLDALTGEMAALFPDDYFHIGGDEVNGKQWDRNAGIKAFIREHSIKNDIALQAYFSSRLQPIVTGHGRRLAAGTKSPPLRCPKTSWCTLGAARNRWPRPPGLDTWESFQPAITSTSCIPPPFITPSILSRRNQPA